MNCDTELQASPQQFCSDHREQDRILHDASTVNRSLRISSIPTMVTESELRTFLQGLQLPKSEQTVNIKAISLQKEKCGLQTATVCFEREPDPISSCARCRKITVPYPYQGKTHDLVVDCDFYGLTPLFSSEKPTVEYVYLVI